MQDSLENRNIEPQSSHSRAFKRLTNFEKKLDKDEQILNEYYYAYMDDYLKKWYARKLTKKELLENW